jgi:dTDP-4-amino-4,6-dideoxygalactose transaminase
MGDDELDLVHEAFRSNYIAPLGPMVEAFENEFAAYTGIPHCLALNSGTAAMHLALRELGVGAGDTVLASTLTFIGSVSPATFLGASLTFIDSDWTSWNMDPELLRAELTEAVQNGVLPKAVIVTDLYGQCADLDRIMEICEPYHIPVVADAAESAGAKYMGRSAGCGSKASVFSFNGNKIITTSGGGMLASEDKKLIDHARKLSQQAREPELHYEHTEIGYNYRLSNILAAIGRGQLRVLDQRVARKREIFATYHRLLGDVPGIEFMPEVSYGQSNRWLTVVLIDEQEFGAPLAAIHARLQAENIEFRPVWKPMHLQPVFKGCKYRGNGVSEKIFRQGLCLPSGTRLTESDLDRIASLIRSARSNS